MGEWAKYALYFLLGWHNRQHLNLSRVARPVVSAAFASTFPANDRRDNRAGLPEQQATTISRHYAKNLLWFVPLAVCRRLHDLGSNGSVLAVHGRLLALYMVCVALVEIPGAVDVVPQYDRVRDFIIGGDGLGCR